MTSSDGDFSRDVKRAVRRALRTGRPADSRIDALARQEADRRLRNCMPTVIWAVILLSQTTLLSLQIMLGGNSLSLALWSASVLCTAMGAGILALRYLTARRYLRTLPPIPAEPP